jgi:hypothetical protein
MAAGNAMQCVQIGWMSSARPAPPVIVAINFALRKPRRSENLASGKAESKATARHSAPAGEAPRHPQEIHLEARVPEQISNRSKFPIDISDLAPLARREQNVYKYWTPPD